MSFSLPAGLDMYRVALHGDAGDRQNGIIVWKPEGLRIQFSNGLGWEHVSVSRKSRIPSWEDMCRVKTLFWGPEACVVQYHPPESEYVNNHPNCLHLWRPREATLPTPPSMLVGVK